MLRYTLSAALALCAPLAAGLDYPALFEPAERTSLTPDLEAKVKTIHRRMGDPFQEGEVLIEFDDVTIKAQAQKAQAQQEKALSAYRAKQTLYERGIVSEAEFLEAKAAWVYAEADLTIAQDRLNKTQLRAPYSGHVVGVSVHEGEYPRHEYYVKDKPMMEIVNDRQLIAKLLVPISQLPKLELGQTVLITVRETGTPVEGLIERMGIVMDPSSSTIPVHVRVQNPGGQLMGGMTGIATVVVDEEEES